jgi:triosephosphate isomerase
MKDPHSQGDRPSVAGFEKRPGAFIRPGAVIIEPAGKAHKAKALSPADKFRAIGRRFVAGPASRSMHSQGMETMEILIAGNWKMNGAAAELGEARGIADGARNAGPQVTVMLCPPATLIDRVAGVAAGTPLLIGGQDCHAGQSGAHTGDISAQMLADAGASAVILGHSERRAGHHESDAAVMAKAQGAARAGLTAIICVGESEAQRDAGEALAVVEAQLDGSVPQLEPAGLVIAYEPVWAIGTGKTPTADDIAAMHHHIRGWLTGRLSAGGSQVKLLYGGSMKPGNAAEILAIADVDGGLIGGASLKAAEFLAIVSAAKAN